MNGLQCSSCRRLSLNLTALQEAASACAMKVDPRQSQAFVASLPGSKCRQDAIFFQSHEQWAAYFTSASLTYAIFNG